MKPDPKLIRADLKVADDRPELHRWGVYALQGSTFLEPPIQTYASFKEAFRAAYERTLRGFLGVAYAEKPLPEPIRPNHQNSRSEWTSAESFHSTLHPEEACGQCDFTKPRGER